MPNLHLEIDTTGLKALAAKYPVAVAAGAARGIEESILLLEHTVKTNIQIGRPPHGSAVSTETLIRGVFEEMRGSEANPYGVVGVSPPADRYALVVEEGRRPGAKMPPPDALIIWIRKKWRGVIGVTATAIGKEWKHRGTRQQARQSAERSLAWILARSIGRKGFPGIHMFRRAFETRRENVSAIIKGHIDAAVAALNR